MLFNGESDHQKIMTFKINEPNKKNAKMKHTPVWEYYINMKRCRFTGGEETLLLSALPSANKLSSYHREYEITSQLRII